MPVCVVEFTMSFFPNDDHDPGGKIRLPLLPRVRGSASFSACRRHRHWLERDWSRTDNAAYILWIGMNPSTAEENIDDRTIRKEQKFTRAWKRSRMIKCNVMDYRATHPDILLRADVMPCHVINLPTILHHANGSDIVVACWGALPDKLQPYADAVVSTLQAADIPMSCLGYTASGNPRHPLYVKDSAKLMPFKQAA